MDKEKSTSELNEEEDEDFDLIKTFKETYEAEKQKIENEEEEKEKDSIWVRSLRGTYKLIFTLVILVGLILCFSPTYSPISGTVLGWIALLLSIVIGISIVGKSLVQMENASNIRRLRESVEILVRYKENETDKNN